MCHVQRIETGGTGLGIPDVNMCHGGYECWVELKIVKGKKVLLDTQQVVWHYQRTRSGGRTFILARDKYDKVRKGKADTLYLWNGNVAQQVAEQGIAYPALETLHAPFDWPRVLKALFPKAY